MTYQILRRVTGKNGRWGGEAKSQRRGRGREQLQSALKKTFLTTIFYLSTHQQVPFLPHHELIQVKQPLAPILWTTTPKCQHDQHHNHCHDHKSCSPSPMRQSSFHLQSLLVFLLEHEVRLFWELPFVAFLHIGLALENFFFYLKFKSD